MAQTHDIFFRVYAVPENQKEEHKSNLLPDDDNGDDDPKWPQHALAFDTESRITVDQSLTFGVYRLCDLVDGNYQLTEEGIFYADDLPDEEHGVLKTYQQTAIMDVAAFPPRFPLYTRSDFMRRVFWPAIKRNGDFLVCGFNLPFDLSRLALAWEKGKKKKRKKKWSLTMRQFPNGVEHRNYPRLLITPLDSKKAFMSLTNPPSSFKKPLRSYWKNKGKVHFLDLHTLLWALYNESYSLERACDNQKGPFKGQNLPQKIEHEPIGEITRDEIEYARQDGRCTVALLNAAKQEFDEHPIRLKAWSAYSPASVAKSYLEAMKIRRPSEKFKLSNNELGIAMQSYYGGRSETRIRCAEVPVVPVDFTSQYPTCCVLLRLFNILISENVTFEDDTENVRKSINGISLEDCFRPRTWEQFNFFALVQPDNDILPVRTMYNEVTQNIGNNYLKSDTPIWFAGPDLIASKMLTGRTPQIMKAIRLEPHGKQTGMQSVNLRRSMVEIDPNKNDDLFKKIIEQRKLHKDDEALYHWLKILANSIYGFFVELNPETRSKRIRLKVFSGGPGRDDSLDIVEKPGKWFFPPFASLITSAGRLLLAMLESCVKEKQGTYLFCDTDSLAIVASKHRASLEIPGTEGVDILSWVNVDEIIARFEALNPYDPKAVKDRSILNLVDANYIDPKGKESRRQLYGYSIAAKRYALYQKLNNDTDIEIVDPKAHGIGFLYPPKNSPKDWEKDVPQWIYEMWDYIVRGALNLNRNPPSWLDIPQMMRLTITTFNVLKMLGDWEIARPYNFMFLPMVDPTFGYVFSKRTNEKVLLVCPFSSKQEHWFNLRCVNVYDAKAKEYRMLDCTKENDPPYDIVFPSQFAHRLIQYQAHPEAKSLAPDGMPCEAETTGLLRRAHVIAREFRYIGKETDHKGEQGDDFSILEFKPTEYCRDNMVVPEQWVADLIKGDIGIRQTMRLTGMSQHTIEKIVRLETVKRTTYEYMVKVITVCRSKIGVTTK